MHTRAKFYVSSVDLKPGQEGGEVKLQAVSRGSRNASWSRYTPSGEMRMSITNPAAFDQFVDLILRSRATGRQPEVYIDIVDAADGYAGDGHKFARNEHEDEIPENSAYKDQCVECGGKQDDKTAHPNG